MARAGIAVTGVVHSKLLHNIAKYTEKVQFILRFLVTKKREFLVQLVATMTKLKNLSRLSTI